MKEDYLSKKYIKNLLALEVTKWAARNTMGITQETLVQYLFKVIDEAKE